MLMILILLAGLVAACVAIHGSGMVLGFRLLRLSHPGHGGHHYSAFQAFRILFRVVCGLLFLHLLQILAWAACYHWAGCLPDFFTAFYYSATSYATVGYGDVVPEGGWRLLGAIEGVTGILMFGWSTGALFSVVTHIQSRFKGHQP